MSLETEGLEPEAQYVRRARLRPASVANVGGGNYYTTFSTRSGRHFGKWNTSRRS